MKKNKLNRKIILGMSILFSGGVFAQKVNKTMKIEVVSSDATIYNLIPKNTEVEILSEESTWAEGPLVLPNEEVIWSDVVGNRVFKWNEKDGAKVWLSPSQYHNGHAIDHEGRIVAASHGKRAIERLEKDGNWIVLVDLYGDKKLNSPNDLVIDKQEEIWFTDPLFGIVKENEGYGGNPVQGGEFVYRFNPSTKKIVRLDTKEIVTPNGIGLSKDQKTLYVADSQIEHTPKPYNTRNVVAYDIDENKNLRNGRIFHQFETGIPDGIAVDNKDNIWVTSGKIVHILSRNGKRIGSLVFPNNVANLTFGKYKNKNVVYITGSNSLFRLNVSVEGAN
ncbi:gluconolactonase [Chishuiella changwenlii]|uniref:Gluconolactonase n=1 Tax=Chishuiella changwenlii TaxID=1434701 RepID=A0A1M7BS77_9FLAO|nr:SMP-30/gluconolactonase/LRE family protein [Chishuiella changwenlii]GGF03443.1 gluconolactonase [Chishuiella changwenlii]SHL57716.1 gluconolactonase [Chishuiella changwenlii]